MKKHLSFFLILACFLNFVFSDLFNEFDYLEQGADWQDENCINVKSRVVMNLSPLDLDPKNAKPFTNSFYFFPKYASTEANVKPSNITLEVNATTEFGKTYTITSGMQVGIYQATSLRIHSEAEHTIEGKRHLVELQIYHQIIQSTQPPDKYQANLFISVFFDNSTDSSSNDLLANITQALTEKSPTTSIDLSYLFDLSATRKTVYSYGGTQTFPPCYPTSWFVFPEPFHASSEQLQILYDLYHNNPEDFKGNGNYRATQEMAAGAQGYFLMNYNSQQNAFTSIDL